MKDRESEITGLINELKGNPNFEYYELRVDSSPISKSRHRRILSSPKLKIIHRIFDGEHDLTVYNKEQDNIPFSHLQEIAVGRENGKADIMTPERTEFTMQDVRDYISRYHSDKKV